MRRGFDLGKGGASPAYLGDDLLGGLVPDERLRVVVPVLDPRLDGVDQIGDAGEGGAAQTAVGELLEPPLDKVQPTRAGRDEVQVPTGSLGISQPLLHFGGLVGRQVVQDHVYVEVLVHVEVDEL